MNKDFVPHIESSELKELGFDEPCFMYYSDNGELYKSNLYGISAPTFSQAFRWFRENYDLFGVVEGKGYEHKRYYIYSINGKWHPSQPAIDTYEEAELACLKKLIEISKNK